MSAGPWSLPRSLTLLEVLFALFLFSVGWRGGRADDSIHSIRFSGRPTDTAEAFFFDVSQAFSEPELGSSSQNPEDQREEAGLHLPEHEPANEEVTRCVKRQIHVAS